MQLGGHGDLPGDAVGAGGDEAGVPAMDPVGSVATSLSWPNAFFGPDGRGE